MHSPLQNGHEDGTVDEPTNEPQGLQEPETEDIRTVPAGNTIYSSATSFEDLNLSPELLQVGPNMCPCLLSCSDKRSIHLEVFTALTHLKYTYRAFTQR